jgi:hypothetical protein
MRATSSNAERVGEELSDIHSEVRRLEKRLEVLRESLRSTETELFRQKEQPPALHEDTLVARIVDGVFSRLAATPRDATQERKQYLTEKEAAKHIGVSVSALRSWRTKRSKNGPPYTRLSGWCCIRLQNLTNTCEPEQSRAETEQFSGTV